MRRIVRRQGYRLATARGDGTHCCANNEGPEVMCHPCREAVAASSPPKVTKAMRTEVVRTTTHTHRCVKATAAPAPIDMAARIRAARDTTDRQSALREQMLAGISYDHL